MALLKVEGMLDGASPTQRRPESIFSMPQARTLFETGMSKKGVANWLWENKGGRGF
jgi:hypothetical protein